jgi:hypothetical protein
MESARIALAAPTERRSTPHGRLCPDIGCYSRPLRPRPPFRPIGPSGGQTPHPHRTDPATHKTGVRFVPFGRTGCHDPPFLSRESNRLMGDTPPHCTHVEPAPHVGAFLCPPCPDAAASTRLCAALHEKGVPEAHPRRRNPADQATASLTGFWTDRDPPDSALRAAQGGSVRLVSLLLLTAYHAARVDHTDVCAPGADSGRVWRFLQRPPGGLVNNPLLVHTSRPEVWAWSTPTQPFGGFGRITHSSRRVPEGLVHTPVHTLVHTASTPGEG